MVQQSNFHDYPLTRMTEVPAIEVKLVGATERISGGGQIGVAPVAPAIANAVFAASGIRLRQLRMVPEYVKAVSARAI